MEKGESGLYGERERKKKSTHQITSGVNQGSEGGFFLEARGFYYTLRLSTLRFCFLSACARVLGLPEVVEGPFSGVPDCLYVSVTGLPHKTTVICRRPLFLC